MIVPADWGKRTAPLPQAVQTQGTLERPLNGRRIGKLSSATDHNIGASADQSDAHRIADQFVTLKAAR